MRHLLFLAAAALAMFGLRHRSKRRRRITRSLTGDTTRQGKADSITNLPVAMDAPIAGTFAQQVDHPTWWLASNTLGTFQQRFWYSTAIREGQSERAR